MNTNYDFLVSLRRAEAEQIAARERLARELRPAGGTARLGLFSRLLGRTPEVGDEFTLAA